MAVAKHELSSLLRLPADPMSPHLCKSHFLQLSLISHPPTPWKLQPLRAMDTSVTTDSQ